MSPLNYYCRVIDTINQWLGKGVSFLLIPLVLVIVYEVIARYGFGAPTIFAHETGLFIYAFSGLLGGGYVLLHGGHVKMDVVYGGLPPRIKAILDLITVPLFFFFCAGLIWGGYEMAHFSVQMGERTASIWHPPLYPLRIAFVVATILLLLQGVAKFIRDFLRVRQRE